jgi:3-methyladenine DNA glycosylase AlkD
MNIYVEQAKRQLSGKSKSTGLKTSDIRSLSAKLFQNVKTESIDTVCALCRDFLEDHSWEMGVIAFDWAYRMKNQYRIETFELFEEWLVTYVRGWGDCDDFCTHAVGELLCQFPALFDRVVEWTTYAEFWMRRAAAVTLIPALHKGKYASFDPFIISDALMRDEHDLVRKGYGWMLKIYAHKEFDRVYAYLKKNKEIMPRVAFRYAIEKMPADVKKELMSK